MELGFGQPGEEAGLAFATGFDIRLYLCAL